MELTGSARRRLVFSSSATVYKCASEGSRSLSSFDFRVGQRPCEETIDESKPLGCLQLKEI